MEKKRIRDFGIVPGRVKTGKRNAITDVPGVLVGHCTVNTEENHTGVTVIIPGPDNAFANHYTAAAYVHNGFGKSAGLVQVEELGTLETPIALTNTLNVGKVWGCTCQYRDRAVPERWAGTHEHQSGRWRSAMTDRDQPDPERAIGEKKCGRLLRSRRGVEEGMSAPVPVPSATA